MLHKTRAIILRQIKYSENSIIVQAFTELFGRQAFIVSGVRAKKSNNKINLFQPMFIVEMEVYYRQKRELQRIKEVKNLAILNNFSTDPVKSSLALFLSEVIAKSIIEEEKDPGLFEFFYNSIRLLDITEKNPANFHLLFMIKLSRFLGFFPADNYSTINNMFDLRTGQFCSSRPLYNEYIPERLCPLFHEFINISMKDFYKIRLNSKIRSELLKHILDYYYLHIEGMPEIKSFSVLTEVFKE